MIRVHFWGTRGSITTPGQATRRYGGNTSCIQLVGFQSSQPGAVIQSGNPHLILDGGSGLVSLQDVLMKGAYGRRRRELHLLLTHYHWDHLIGLPFFRPMFVKGNRIVFYGASIQDLQSAIERLFISVYSPVRGVQNVIADIEYREVKPDGMEVSGFQVRAAEAHHPGTTLAFSVQYGPHKVVYSPDHGVGNPEIDAKLVELARSANLWIMDAFFNSRKQPQHEDWGHSSHLEAVKLAMEAGVETAVLAHYNSAYDDHTVDQMGFEAVEAAAGSQTKVLMARDGMVVDVGGG